MERVFVALGSNVGARERYLQQAIDQLGRLRDVDVIQQSSIYETAPVGFVDQGAFLNMVVELTINVSPVLLLEQCLAIEGQLGRVRRVHRGPREIDIDIILYGDRVIVSEQLLLPHPRFHERDFVLVPLAEIAPEVVDPLSGKMVRVLLEECEMRSVVRKDKR